VTRLRWALAILFSGLAWGAAPSYSVESIVSAGSYAPGPFAPNALITIFGADLSNGPRAVLPADIVGNALPTELNSTRVYIDNFPAPLFYVSERQINLLVPGRQALGKAEIHVVRQGQRGPLLTIDIAAASPALFVNAGYIIATHGDNSLITGEKPARPGDLIVVYAAGLGKTKTMPANGELPPYLSPLNGVLKVTVGGIAVDPAKILYAGLTPMSAGLYQINFYLPVNLGSDPELRLFIGDTGSPSGLKLPVRGNTPAP
jgi:uncharacterized protein (TIGR03437 family)